MAKRGLLMPPWLLWGILQTLLLGCQHNLVFALSTISRCSSTSSSNTRRSNSCLQFAHRRSSSNNGNNDNRDPRNEPQRSNDKTRQRQPLTKLPPHAGYHGGVISNRNQPFFEGWYLRVILPKTHKDDADDDDDDNGAISSAAPSFAFIFHVFDPESSLSRRQGVGLQVITPEGTVVVETPHVSRFRADSKKLNVSQRFSSTKRRPRPNQTTTATTTVDALDFFHLTTAHVSGRASTSSWYSSPPINRNKKVEEGDASSCSSSISSVFFDFDMIPLIGWGGGVGQRQYSTAGWLAAFPIFEPHYQVLISKGVVVPSGSITIEKKQKGTPPTIYDLTGASVYLEKNWGASFPSAWWWIQANTFHPTPTSSSSSGKGAGNDETDYEEDEIDLSVTSTGAKRRIALLMQEEEEEVALVGLHWNGEFLPFPTVYWMVKWGEWKVSGSYEDYFVELMGTCPESDKGVPIRCPTDSGMKEIALETFQGTLRVKLYQKGVLVLDVTSSEACLEMGGLPWTESPWIGDSAMVEPVKSIAMNVELERSVSDVLQVLSRFVNIPGL